VFTALLPIKICCNHGPAKRLFLYTQKTGVAVNTILPEFLRHARERTPEGYRKTLLLGWYNETGNRCGELEETVGLLV
jgi:hypothetical protein